jgi:hypothetical protein
MGLSPEALAGEEARCKSEMASLHGIPGRVCIGSADHYAVAPGTSGNRRRVGHHATREWHHCSHRTPPRRPFSGMNSTRQVSITVIDNGAILEGGPSRFAPTLRAPCQQFSGPSSIMGQPARSAILRRSSSALLWVIVSLLWATLSAVWRRTSARARAWSSPTM